MIFSSQIFCTSSTLGTPASTGAASPRPSGRFFLNSGRFFLELVTKLEMEMEMVIEVNTQRKIALVTDSRGGFLQHFLNLYNDNPYITYTTFVFKGRRIEELWLQAKQKLLSGEFYHVYIWGGICNLTSPYFWNGTRSFWPLKHVDDLAHDLIHAINLIANEVNFLDLKGRISFLPETGANLITYNSVCWPQPWMQQCQRDLNINVLYLRDSFKEVNSRMGCSTPWTFDVIFGRNKRGMQYPKYDKLYDGLHPAPRTSAEISRKIIKDANAAVSHG